MPKRGGVQAKNYVLHLTPPRGKKTLCGRVAAVVNCSDYPNGCSDDAFCRACLKKMKTKETSP